MYNVFRILIKVPDYSSSLFVFFQKMMRKLSPQEEKIFRDKKRKYENDISTKYLGTTKASTRMI